MYCNIIPKFKNKKGEEVESILFKDLLKFTNNNREQTKVIYAKSKLLKDEWHNKRIETDYDKNGEPLLATLIRETNLREILTEQNILNALNDKIGYYKYGENRPKLNINNEKNYNDLLKKANNFNAKSPYNKEYYAKVINIQDWESPRMFIGVKVFRRQSPYNNAYYNISQNSEVDKMDYNEALNIKLRNILSENGIAIGALTDLEERLKINGVTDFSVAKEATNGIIELIRLAKGIQGENALPEEFAHFAIEALSNNKFIERFINHLMNDNNTYIQEILGEDYNKYSVLYKNDKLLLAKEAAGKLLADALVNVSEIKPQHKSIIQKVIQAIKDFFNQFNISDFEKMKIAVNKEFYNLASDILNDNVSFDITKLNNNNTKLFNIDQRIKSDKELLKKIIANETKRLNIYKKTNNTKFLTTQENLINKLNVSLNNNKEIDAIYSYLENVISELKSLNTKLINIRTQNITDANYKAGILRNINNYYYSYFYIIDDIRQNLLKEEKFADNRYGSKVRTLLDEISPMLQDLRQEYLNEVQPLFIDFLKTYLGDELYIAIGKNKGDTINTEDVAKFIAKDISLIDRWLKSMGESHNLIHKVFDQAVKKQNNEARLDTIEDKKYLQKLGKELEESGIKNTDWMYEKDKDGKLTGNWISEIDYSLYRKEYKKFIDNLNKKYNLSIAADFAKYKEEKNKWIIENNDIINNKITPKKSKYANKQYDSLSSKQKEFYEKIIKLKEKLDKYLPENYTKTLNAPKIYKDLLDRMKSSSSAKELSKQLKKAVGDQLLAREDDEEISDRVVLEDFEQNRVNTLPIYYTTMDKANMNDMSTDVISTMIAYSAMAHRYDSMNAIINILELSKNYAREIDIQETIGNKKLKSTIRLGLEKVHIPLLKKKDASNFIERLNDFFDMQVYNRYIKDEGSINVFGKNVDLGKLADSLNMITGINRLAFNTLSIISNPITGNAMMHIEGVAREFFNESDILKADAIYTKNNLNRLSQIGGRIKTNKLDLFDEKFDVMQNYDVKIRDTDFNRRNIFSKMFKTDTLYAGQNAGEHWMQNRTAIAVALQTKMKDNKGKSTNLWDALEIVPIDKNNPNIGATLEIKKGYTKEDGTEFTRDDIYKFTRKIAAINQRMHGIYNREDKNAFQAMAIGRLAMQFRKFLVPSLVRRFDTANWNPDLEKWTEGYYITAGKFFTQMIKDLKKSQFDIASQWNNLNDTEKANIRRTFTELAMLTAVSILASIISNSDWDNDENIWVKRMAEYQILRLRTEIGALAPTPMIIDEGFRLLKSPMAGIETAQSLIDLIGIFNPLNYEFINGEDAVMKSGKYKDMSKAEKYFLQSPLVPTYSTMMSNINPEDKIPFFKAQ
ncbi:MAG: hypothetical protein LBM96_05840 [Methanobrevibacter sp.]|jgi:hypothetical protein|nr:hypothetical protein [Candidatus Methanoflexus mossambicus]